MLPPRYSRRLIGPENPSRTAIENIALRHQIGVLQRSAKKRVLLNSSDRLLWGCVSRVWPDWRSALVIVPPGDGDRVASERLSIVLDVESPPREAPTTICPEGGSRLDSRWRTFLDNHIHSLVSIDFFTVPTIRFQIL